MALFERGGLEQDTGLLSERWGQEGSEIFNNAATRNTDITLVTVTAGKRLFVKSLVACNVGGLAGNFALRDGSGGSLRCTVQMSAVIGDVVSINFDTPLYFDTEVYFDEIVACQVGLTLTGWEENYEG